MKYSRIGTENGYQWITSITTNQLALMLYMTEQCTPAINNGVVVFTSKHKKQIAEHLSLTYQGVDKMLKGLIEKGFVVSVGDSTYMVNPYLVSNGKIDWYGAHYKRFSNIMYESFSPLCDKITDYGWINLNTGECSSPLERIDEVYKQACDIAGEFNMEAL